MASKYIPEKGVTLDFPGMTDEQMNQMLNSGQYDEYIKNMPAAQTQAGPPAGAPPLEGGTPAFPIAVPPGSTADTTIPQQAPPGFAREANIAGRNIIAGGMDVAGIPGDLWALTHRLTGGMVPEGPSWLPTSAGVDRFASNIGVLDPRYVPSGFWENALAVGSRGLGGAAVMGGGPAAIGRGLEFAASRIPGSALSLRLGSAGAAMPATPTLAQGGRIAATGIGGAEAADQTRQGMTAMGYRPENDPLGLGELLPLAAGSVVGAGVGGALDPYLGATPYQRALNTLNTSKSAIAAKPLLEDAGDSLKSTLLNPASPPNPLSKLQTNALIGPKNNFAGESVAANAMNPQIAPKLISAYPDEMNKIATSTIANGRWPTLNDHTKEALLPNDQERAAVEAIHGGKSIAPEHAVPLFVGSESLGALSGGLAYLMHNDPMLSALIGATGAALPYVPTAIRAYSRFARTSPGTVSGLGIGAGAAMPTSSSMGVSMAAPSSFAPPGQGGPEGQRTDINPNP